MEAKELCAVCRAAGFNFIVTADLGGAVSAASGGVRFKFKSVPGLSWATCGAGRLQCRSSWGLSKTRSIKGSTELVREQHEHILNLKN